MIEPVRIGERLVGPGHKPFVIAEACINHQGQIAIAERMVHMAHALGADAIKFQIHVLDNEMLRQAPQSDNFDEPLYDTLDKTNLSVDEHRRLKKLCESLGILYLCTPFSRIGADLLEELGVAAYKVGSGELTNLPLQEHVARKGKPVIISTGMATIEEIAETVELVRGIGTPFILTHCVSAYPAPYHIVNLNVIPRYLDLFKVPVGLSDHSRGIYTSLGAVALGACLIEKHFTLDKLQKGPDHPSSLEPFELGELVKGAEAVFLALGDDKRIFPEEEQIVAWARESVVSETRIPAGTKITPPMVWVKRPSPGVGVVPAKDLKNVLGRVARVDIPAGVQVKWEYLQ
jgi:N-acetylneuraminate synthase